MWPRLLDRVVGAARWRGTEGDNASGRGAAADGDRAGPRRGAAASEEEAPASDGDGERRRGQLGDGDDAAVTALALDRRRALRPFGGYF